MFLCLCQKLDSYSLRLGVIRLISAGQGQPENEIDFLIVGRRDFTWDKMHIVGLDIKSKMMPSISLSEGKKLWKFGSVLYDWIQLSNYPIIAKNESL